MPLAEGNLWEMWTGHADEAESRAEDLLIEAIHLHAPGMAKPHAFWYAGVPCRPAPSSMTGRCGLSSRMAGSANRGRWSSARSRCPASSTSTQSSALRRAATDPAGALPEHPPPSRPPIAPCRAVWPPGASSK